jgi:hypothetical protein
VVPLTLDEREMPPGIRQLARDRRGYPVPWFVVWLDGDGNPVDPGAGDPDFRVLRPHAALDAMREGTCWICGKPMVDGFTAYVAGPMCAVNRTSAEPPSHRGCAIYAAKVCPFLTKPHMHRREANLPTNVGAPPGEMIRRNPGVAMVWVTNRPLMPFNVPRAFTPAHPGILFHLPDPLEVLWFAQGQKATREQVLRSIDTGLPLLAEAARSDPADAEAALAQLDRQVRMARRLVPA